TDRSSMGHTPFVPTDHGCASYRCTVCGTGGRAQARERAQASASYAAACSASCTGGGCGLSNIRWVSTMTVRSRTGSASHVVPKPPAQPNAPARGPAVTTEVQKPQLISSKKPG